MNQESIVQSLSWRSHCTIWCMRKSDLLGCPHQTTLGDDEFSDWIDLKNHTPRSPADIHEPEMTTYCTGVGLCGPWIQEFIFFFFVEDKGELLPLTIVMNRSAELWLHNQSSNEKRERVNISLKGEAGENKHVVIAFFVSDVFNVLDRCILVLRLCLVISTCMWYNT